MNARDGNVLYTEVDDRCNKLAVDRRRYCLLSLADYDPVFHAESTFVQLR